MRPLRRFHQKGAFFPVKGASRAPQIPDPPLLAPPPRLEGVGVRVEFGECARPLYREKKAPFPEGLRHTN